MSITSSLAHHRMSITGIVILPHAYTPCGWCLVSAYPTRRGCGSNSFFSFGISGCLLSSPISPSRTSSTTRCGGCREREDISAKGRSPLISVTKSGFILEGAGVVVVAVAVVVEVGGEGGGTGTEGAEVFACGTATFGAEAGVVMVGVRDDDDGLEFGVVIGGMLLEVLGDIAVDAVGAAVVVVVVTGGADVDDVEPKGMPMASEVPCRTFSSHPVLKCIGNILTWLTFR